MVMRQTISYEEGFDIFGQSLRCCSCLIQAASPDTMPRSNVKVPALFYRWIECCKNACLKIFVGVIPKERLTGGAPPMARFKENEGKVWHERKTRILIILYVQPKNVELLPWSVQALTKLAFELPFFLKAHSSRLQTPTTQHNLWRLQTTNL